ncbi:MAG: amidohydrolase/deacetylase family metallohydrolase [Candidatus Latescibacteria bacterium]|nr:amidohydrolase/deacetylase family metallohydrolase [Candidatus Latescibacterota bacterium]
MAHELIFRGAHVVDPSQGIDSICDVSVKGNVIAAVAPSIEDNEAEIIDVAGKFLTPGWIDLHAHVYAGATTFGIKADGLCLATGVTTVVDAGSPGWTNLRGFIEFIVEPSRTRVLSFVHISSIGLLNSMRGEMEDIKNADPEMTARVIAMWPEICPGVKVRQGIKQVGENDTEPLRLAIAAAEMADTRVMVHMDQGVSLPKLLGLLRPGDIVTHCYQGKGDHILDASGQVLDAVYEARDRGIIFDLGHGAGSFHYDVAQEAVKQGFLSDVISTDLHVYSLFDPVYSLPETASKLLNMGLPFDEIVRQTTLNPADAIGRAEHLGTLRPGSVADIAVFDILEGSFVYTDSHGNQESGSLKIEPVFTVRDGKRYFPDELREEIEETTRRAIEMKTLTGMPYGRVRGANAPTVNRP